MIFITFEIIAGFSKVKLGADLYSRLNLFKGDFNLNTITVLNWKWLALFIWTQV